MEPNQTKPRRPPPKLRTKTGCFTCRQRRKKCNEAKPRCADCAKQSLHCVWPALKNGVPFPSTGGLALSSIIVPKVKDVRLRSGSRFPFADDSARIGMIRSTVYGFPGISTSTEHYIASLFSLKLVPTLLRANAHAAFHDYTPLIVLSAGNDALMHSFFAAAASREAHTDPKCKHLATKYYNSAITHINKAIVSNTIKGDEGWVMIAINFLCLFETISEREFGVPSGAVFHLEGLARVLSLRAASDLRANVIARDPCCRVSAESFVFNITLSSLFYSDTDRLVDVFSWDDLKVTLEYEPFPDAQPYENSPLLVCDWRIWKSFFEITRLSHQVPLNATLRIDGQALELRILDADRRFRQDLVESENNPRIHRLLQDSHMSILASQILMFKTLHPEIHAEHPKIKQLVQEILNLLQRIVFNVKCSVVYLWPVAIVSCAITSKDEVKILRRAISDIWIYSHDGEALRLAKATKFFWKVHNVGEEESLRSAENQTDILDILINGRGIFQHPALCSMPAK